MHEQPSRGVLKKRCSKNMQQNRRTPMLKCDFNKFALQYICDIYVIAINQLYIFRATPSKNTSGRLLLNTYLQRRLRVTVFVLKDYLLDGIIRTILQIHAYYECVSRYLFNKSNLIKKNLKLSEDMISFLQFFVRQHKAKALLESV